MIDHIGIEVRDYERAREFYRSALNPLNYVLTMESDGLAGFGAAGKPDFWIHAGEKNTPHVHVAFQTESRETVKRFYDAALQAGGKDNGAPGLRPEYHPNYYAAFVLTPDGHNIEAVCHSATTEERRSPEEAGKS